MTPIRNWFAMALLTAVPVVVGCGSAASAVEAPRGSEDAKLEAEIRQVPIVMYMAPWCPVCQKARAWLRDGGYRFVEHDVDADSRAALFLAVVNPRGAVPMFEIEGQIIVGFDPKLMRLVLRRAVARRSGSPSERVATQ